MRSQAHVHIHAPQTPSPLRTSRNVNLMPRSAGQNKSDDETPLLSSSPLGRKFADHDDENDIRLTGAGHHNEKTAPADDSPLITPPDSSHRPASFNPTFAGPSFAFSIDNPTRNVSSQTGWETKFRNGGAAASLARHATQQREQKKTQFLDRIRRRRDDSRSEMYGDQVLRMDFVRERRRWEDEMKRRALMEAGELAEVDSNMEEAEDEAHFQMSPTEEHDLDELYPMIGAPHDLGHDDRDNDDFVFDDDEYDELFLEFLSQEQQMPAGIVAQEQSRPQGLQQHQQQQQLSASFDQEGHSSRQDHDSGDQQRPYDSSMDLS